MICAVWLGPYVSCNFGLMSTAVAASDVFTSDSQHVAPSSTADATSAVYFDAVLTAGLIVFGVCLDLGLVVSSRAVDVSAGDPRYSRLPTPESSLIASPRSAAAVSGLLAPLFIILVDGCIRESTMPKTFWRLTGYAFGIGLLLTANGALRAAGGGAAPDFWANCAASAGISRVTDLQQCASPVPLYARASFPSTPAALYVYSSLMFAMYARNHVHMLSSVAALLLQTAPVIGGLAAAAAQAADARAHVGDVVVGILVGVAASTIVQFRFLGGIKRSFYGEDASELKEFLLAAGAVAIPRALSGSVQTSLQTPAQMTSAPQALKHLSDGALKLPPPLVPQTPLLQPPAQQRAGLSNSGYRLSQMAPAEPGVPPHLMNPMLSPRSISARMAAVHARAMARSDGASTGNIDVLAIDAGIAENK